MKKMNRSGNMLFCLCAALLLAADMGRAETVLWSDDFDDSDAASRWKASTPGVWHIGSPTAGPAKNSEGYRTHSGANCASTQLYAYKDSRLVCNNYDGNSSLVIPSADQFPRLRFWHWFKFGNALGFVEISTDAGATWQQISPTYTYDGTDNATSGGVWSRPSIDLSAYAGQSVQIAFHFTGLCCGNGLGWYVDDVAVVTDEPVFNNPEGFESDWDDWAVDSGTWEIGQPTSGPKAAHTGDNCAATVLAGNYTTNVDSRLISPPFLVPSNGPALRFWHWYNFNSALGFVEISTDAGGTWNQISSTYQNGNTGNVWKNVSVDLSAYAGKTAQVAFRFASVGVGVAAGWYVDDISLAGSPTLTVPPTQTIYAGQTPDFTLSATLFPTNDTPRFGLVSHSTNVVLNTTTGVLTWTNTAPLVPSTNKITVTVTDTNTQLSATNSFIVQVLPPLVVTVPPTQTNYVGQKLDVTISATNYSNPDDYFTFKTISPTPTNVLIDPYTGELTWIPVAAQKGSNTITITVTNNIAPFLRATNHFVVVVSTNIPPPTLTVPNQQNIYAGQTLTVTNSATSVFPNSTFTFVTNSPPTPAGVILVPTNGVLTWAIPTTNMAASYRISVTVTDSVSKLIATKSFLVVVSTNPPPPMLIVPPTQTNYAGQTMIVTNHAYYTNSVLPSSAFTFVLLSGPANAVLNPTTGILTWVIPMTQPAGTTNLSIMVTDCVSHLIATSNFLVQVLPPKPPTLIVPPMQLIYAGQTMDVTISATSVYPDPTFTYTAGAVFGPPYLDVSDLPTHGVLKWTPSAAQATNIYTIYVTVTDNNLLSTISNFLVLVSMPPPPGLTVPPVQTLKVNGFQFTLNTMPDTIWRIDASTNLLSWRSLVTNKADSSGTLQFTDSPASYPRRFYRAVLQ